MTTTSRIRSFGRRSLLAALSVGAVALAVTTSGCLIDSGPGNGYGGGGCAPDLLIDWSIQNSTAAPVTCDGAGAATVSALVTDDTTGVSTPYNQPCQAGQANGQFDVFLAGTGNTDVTVNLFDSKGNSLLLPQSQNSITLNITSCYTSETPSPALLVVTPTP